jgi:hypothetical protein
MAAKILPFSQPPDPDPDVADLALSADLLVRLAAQLARLGGPPLALAALERARAELA